MKIASPISLILFLLASLCTFAHAQETEEKPQLTQQQRELKVKEVSALARSYLGSEETLNSVKSLKTDGVLVYGSGESGTFEAVYRKPSHHQFISVVGGARETSTLDGSEAWRKLEDLRTPNSYNLSFYETDDILHLQATVRDYLNFLDTPPTRKGRIEYLGTSEVKGVSTEVLLYVHSDRIWFRRYIDAETGRVLHMVNDKGIIFSYEGAIEVGGVKFPERTIVRVVTQYGTQTMELSFSNIKINEDVDLERFQVPSA